MTGFIGNIFIGKILISKILAGMLIASALSGPAFAQTPANTRCGERADVTEHLRKTFGERRVGNGLSDSGVAIEVFAGPQGSFTIFATTPQGQSCMLIAGDGWEPLPQPERYASR